MRARHAALRLTFSTAAVATAAGVVACSASSSGGPLQGSGGQGGAGDLGLGRPGDDAILASAPPCDVTDVTADADGDGFSIAEGDCNDCTRQMNPGAYDYPGNGVDEDCDGEPDDSPTDCDEGLALDSAAAADGARAIGLCKQAAGKGWGLVSARYVTADAQPLGAFDPAGVGHGILTGFGEAVHPQEGKRLLALSSGTARQPGDPGYRSVAGFDKMYGPPDTFAPTGFPRESPSCPGVVTGPAHDSAALEVKLRVPTNALSLGFDLDFYTYEFPDFICSAYNDFFVALLSPPPAAQPDGNISFDTLGNLVSVNAGFLQVCEPQAAGGKNFGCPLGKAQLAGTGFDLDAEGAPVDNSAATGWLRTTAPVDPGTLITLRFAVWDSGDGILDSTVLIDNFGWGVSGAGTSTEPVSVPK